MDLHFFCSPTITFLPPNYLIKLKAFIKLYYIKQIGADPAFYRGAMTLSIMTLSIMTLTVTELRLKFEWHSIKFMLH